MLCSDVQALTKVQVNLAYSSSFKKVAKLTLEKENSITKKKKNSQQEKFHALTLTAGYFLCETSSIYNLISKVKLPQTISYYSCLMFNRRNGTLVQLV